MPSINPMKPEEQLLAAIATADLTKTEAALRLRVSRRTITYWLAGERRIPAVVLVAAPKMLRKKSS